MQALIWASAFNISLLLDSLSFSHVSLLETKSISYLGAPSIVRPSLSPKFHELVPNRKT